MTHTKRNTAFYIETVALLLLLLFGISVLVQVFGKAQQMGHQAKTLAVAAPLARNAAEVFAACDDPAQMAAMLSDSAYALGQQSVVAFYDEEGVATTPQQAYYTLEMTFAQGQGTQKATVTVSCDLQTLYTLETENYRGRG